jgi:hypothetical protein
MEFQQIHSPFPTTTVYDGCSCIKTEGGARSQTTYKEHFFLSSNAQDITEGTDRQTVSYHALGRGNKGELNGSRGKGRLRMMSQLPAKIPHGHVTSDVFLPQINNVDKCVIWWYFQVGNNEISLRSYTVVDVLDFEPSLQYCSLQKRCQVKTP